MLPNRRVSPSGTAPLAVYVADRVVRAYQIALSPLLGSRCRFAPSCSEYARAALQRYGVWRGSWMALRRLSHCHPLHRGGWDPVR